MLFDFTLFRKREKVMKILKLSIQQCEEYSKSLFIEKSEIYTVDGSFIILGK